MNVCIFMFVFLINNYISKFIQQESINNIIAMNKTAIVLTTLAILLSTYYISSLDLNNQNLTLDPPKTVDYVDLTRYVGKWYEQASIPAPFQYNCQRTTAIYTMNSDDSIKV